MSSTDKAWEKWGANDPYFAVLTLDKFHNKNLNKKLKAEFFASGQYDIGLTLKAVAKMDKSYAVNTALDFGCGVGRLTIPLARRSKHAIGLDVSESMLKEAQANVPPELLKKVSFIKLNDNLVNLPKNYNFIFSYIVFQHIPKKRGYAIANELLKNLDEGGFAALHFTIHEPDRIVFKLVRRLSHKIFFVNWLVNLYIRRPLTAPNMQMNIYKLDQLVKIFRNNGIQDVVCKSDAHGRGMMGVMIIGKKQAQESKERFSGR